MLSRCTFQPTFGGPTKNVRRCCRSSNNMLGIGNIAAKSENQSGGGTTDELERMRKGERRIPQSSSAIARRILQFFRHGARLFGVSLRDMLDAEQRAAAKGEIFEASIRIERGPQR